MQKILKNHTFTLKVKWGAEIKQPDGTVHVLPSFYAVYDNDKCLTKQSFQNTLIAEEIHPAFYLGGFVYSTKNTINEPSSSLLPQIIQKKSDSRVVKSKCFTGVVCNLEILKTSVKNIPSELFDFIVKRQKMKNRRMPPAHDDDDNDFLKQFIKKDVWMMSSSSSSSSS